MTWEGIRHWVFLAAGFALGAFVGRSLAPTKIQTKEVVKVETVEVVKWKEKIVQVKGPVRIITRTVKVPGPQGETVTVEKIVEREKVVTVRDDSGTSATATDEERIKEKVVESRPWAAVQLEGAWDVGKLTWEPQVWSLNGSFRVLGPLWVGGGVTRADKWMPQIVARWEF